MAKKKQLRKRQLELIDDLFEGQLDERTVLEKHKVSRNVYNKWLADEEFKSEFARRVAGARLQSEALIAKYSLVAAVKLVQLINSRSQETARKVCLDIISLPKVTGRKGKQSAGAEQAGVDEGHQIEQLSPQTASRLLAALAEEKDGG